MRDLDLILGVVKNNRFSYARALISPRARFSILLREVAEDLRCIERTEDLAEYEYRFGENMLRVIGVCSVDKVVFNGYVVEIPAVFHVAESLGGEKLYEAIIGLDLISAWGLYIDLYTGVVRSRFGRKTTLFT
ncbi:MAG: hypothetical protein ABWJ42_00125 [Sulfolobales archaeon]